MVGIGMIERLPDRLSDTAHPRFAGPEKVRKLFGIPKMVERTVLRHFGPVNPAHVLPPSKDLPEESFDLGKTNGFWICLPTFQSTLDQLPGMKDFGV